MVLVAIVAAASVSFFKKICSHFRKDVCKLIIFWPICRPNTSTLDWATPDTGMLHPSGEDTVCKRNLSKCGVKIGENVNCFYIYRILYPRIRCLPSLGRLQRTCLLQKVDYFRDLWISKSVFFKFRQNFQWPIPINLQS